MCFVHSIAARACACREKERPPDDEGAAAKAAVQRQFERCEHRTAVVTGSVGFFVRVCVYVSILYGNLSYCFNAIYTRVS